MKVWELIKKEYPNVDREYVVKSCGMTRNKRGEIRLMICANISCSNCLISPLKVDKSCYDATREFLNKEVNEI